MKTLVSVLILVALAATSSAALEHQASKQQATGGSSLMAEQRQARAISSSGGNGNSLLGGLGHSNTIEHSSSKSRLEQEKRQVQEFLTTKNIFKSIVKLLFGNQDEISATSRHVLGVLSKVLDLLKNTFGQKSRSGSARTIRDSAEDAANASVSMLQGYVKSVLANDGQCAKRYLCQASKEATRDGRDLGYIIASVGGYATSYLLDTSKSAQFNDFHEASLRGRQMKEDCAKLYPDCAD